MSTSINLGGGETALINSTVFKDNNGAFITANSIKMTLRTKQIGVKYHFLKHHFVKGSVITLVKVDTLLK